MADCAEIANKLDEVDWFSLFSEKRMDCCVDLFYEMVWSSFFWQSEIAMDHR
jgi:hypothetical protein